MTLVDSHCHLDDEQFDGDREAVIGRALRCTSDKISYVNLAMRSTGPAWSSCIRNAIRTGEVYCALFRAVKSSSNAQALLFNAVAWTSGQRMSARRH